jgi:drug/metabolite transporter (DMT)-like permease
MPFDALFLRVAPFLFVLIWSTGWVAAGYAAPYADALTFLAIRFALAALLLALLSLAFRASWPATPRAWGHALVAGMLMHGAYLAGVWVAVRMGLPAGVSGLIAALQPLLITAFSPLILGERISGLRWLGSGLGVVGLALILAPKLAGLDETLLWQALVPIVINVIGMVSVVAGTFYQKRFLQTGDLRTMTAVQYVGALMVVVPPMLAVEQMHVAWNMTVILTMAWSVLGLSLGGIGLYLWLVRHGEVSRAAALVYLVPPLAAAQAWLFFGERLSPIQLLGIAVTVTGVVLATRPAKAR